MELINRIRKSRKGFTLVEIIVVLVILAILAAFTIPTMLGFVSDAKSKAMIAEAREVYVAAQSTATEFAVTNATEAQLNSTYVADTTNHNDKATKQMRKYIGKDLTAGATQTATVSYWTVDIDETNTAQVKSITYSRDSRQVQINAGGEVTVIS